MSATTYTPGPWKIDITRRAIVGDSDTQVAIVRGDPDCNAANASLIAAAPEMYALLERIHGDAFETLDEGGEAVVAISPDLIVRINLLLAKARGEED